MLSTATILHYNPFSFEQITCFLDWRTWPRSHAGVDPTQKKREKKCTIHSCFSFWTWVDWCLSMFPFGRHSNPALDTASELAILNADFIPRAAFFAVFVPRNTCLHGDTELRLYCIPSSKRCEVIDYEERLGNILIGDGCSDRPMCPNEKAYIFLSDGIVTPLNPRRLQRLYIRWGNLFSNEKCYIFLGCDWFYRPCIFYS